MRQSLPSSKTAASSWTTASPEETKRLAARLAKKLRRGDVVLLIANLGAGKTTFIQGFAGALSVKEDALSPTFVIAQTLKGSVPIHHLDLYRLSKAQILERGLQDYLSGGGEIEKGIVLMEWADRCRGLWPPERLEVRITIEPKSFHRRIMMTAAGDRYKRVLTDLKGSK